MALQVRGRPSRLTNFELTSGAALLAAFAATSQITVPGDRPGLKAEQHEVGA
jgi:hypothetical protein